MNTTINWPRIYFFGDSLTQYAFSSEGCWASIISDSFQRKADIITRGLSGYNTRWSKAVLPYLKSDLRDVSVASVFLGANDAQPAKTTQQHIPVKEYKNNLRDIIQHFKDSGVKKTFLIGPPPRDLTQFKECCFQKGRIYNYDGETENNTLIDYVNACSDLAKEEKIPCIDLYHAMLECNDWQEMLIDGLHFSTKGSQFVAEQILPVIQSCLQGAKEGSTLILPDWSEVDPTNPDKSLKDWMKKWQES